MLLNVYSTAMINAEHKSDVEFVNSILYLILMGELWRVYYKKSLALDARRTLGMSNLIIFYSLLNILLLLLIDLDILSTILPKTDVPYPWIWLLYLVSINSACRLP